MSRSCTSSNAGRFSSGIQARKQRARVRKRPAGESADGSTQVYLDSGQVAMVSRVDSPFGDGWWLAGYERLYPLRPPRTLSQPNDSLLWVGGDGSTRV